jgi:hypothetical protein
MTAPVAGLAETGRGAGVAGAGEGSAVDGAETEPAALPAAPIVRGAASVVDVAGAGGVERSQPDARETSAINILSLIIVSSFRE